MYIVKADDQLSCNKCWFASIDPGENCISDAPPFRRESRRNEVESIRHWHLSRPDHPDSCYEREIREWSSSPESEPAETELSCSYCGHDVSVGSDVFTEQIWLPVDNGSEGSSNIEPLRKQSGFRVRDVDGNLLDLAYLVFHDGCITCGLESNCHSLYAQAMARGESPQFEWSDENRGGDESEDSDLDGPPGIAERVRFWEEQDEINKVLIPRVIRQHELLAKHIREHEDLSLVVARAIGQAANEAREEQRKLYEAAKSEFDERFEAQQRQYDDSLSAAHTEFSDTLETQISRMRNFCLIVVASAVVAMLLISVLMAILLG